MLESPLAGSLLDLCVSLRLTSSGQVLTIFYIFTSRALADFTYFMRELRKEFPKY